MSAPNAVWTIDFKGQFRTQDGIYCYPLTLVDGFSRYLLDYWFHEDPPETRKPPRGTVRAQSDPFDILRGPRNARPS